MSHKRVSEMTDEEIRDLCGCRDVPGDSARDAANRAAEAMRLLNYLTLPHDGAPGLTHPSHVYDVIGSLKVMTQRMPQLLRQLSLWLGEQNAAGKVAHDTREAPGQYVADVRELLDAAEGYAAELEAILNRAHNASSGLKAAG
jgi:hypothetical protein